MTRQLLVNPEQVALPDDMTSDWQFWQANTAWGFYLYAQTNEEQSATNSEKAARCLHLGAFNDLGSLKVQQLRFLENINTTVVLDLSCADLQEWLEQPETISPPKFEGLLGTAWSGYRVKEVSTEASIPEVELVYAADLRHEWLGIFTEADAFAAIEQHYDRRRNQCLLC